MKILMIPSWYPNKKDIVAGIFTKEFSQDLLKYCEVAVFYPFDDTVKESLRFETEEGLPVFRTSMQNPIIPKTGFIQNTIRYIVLFKKVVKKFKPDIIHAHVSCPAGYIAAILGKIYNIPVIITEHNAPRFLLNSSTLVRRVRYAIANSSLVVCVSKHLQKEMETYGFKGNFTTIYNGVRSVDETKESIDDRHSDQVTISCVASMYDKEVKGLKYLLEAVKQLILEENQNITLHIVGGGVYFDYFKEMTITLGIEKNCVLHGSLSKENTYEVINSSDFYVSSSLYETFGCSIVEAMMHGKPVLATKCGGPEEIIIKETGLLIEKESSQELAEGIKYMSAHYREYDKKLIKKHAISNFSAEATVEKYLKVYRDITK